MMSVKEKPAPWPPKPAPTRRTGRRRSRTPPSLGVREDLVGAGDLAELLLRGGVGVRSGWYWRASRR